MLVEEGAHGDGEPSRGFLSSKPRHGQCPAALARPRHVELGAVRGARASGAGGAERGPCRGCAACRKPRARPPCPCQPGGDAGTRGCCFPAVFPVAQSSCSPSPPPCSGAGSRGRRASHGAVTRVPAELQHSRETAFICCDSFATDSLAELTANCNPKLSDGSFFQPGSVRNKFVWVIKTY